MSRYADSRPNENLQKGIFGGVGLYDVPKIEPTQIKKNLKWIPFNMAKSCKQRDSVALHTFVDDFQLGRLWRNIDKYVSMIRSFDQICSPDFSLYADYPRAVQIWNHYRKQWIAAYLQKLGVDVVATASWSSPDSFAWCFDGMPVGGAVAVSSVGCMDAPYEWLT